MIETEYELEYVLIQNEQLRNLGGGTSVSADDYIVILSISSRY